MAEGTLPTAKSAHSPDERDKLRQMVIHRSLCGLANDTKWDEFIAAMRDRSGWKPSYRYKCIDGPPSRWDFGWFYHLPFPLISVEWIDITHLEEIRIHRLPPRVSVIDHSAWLVRLLQRIGLDFRIGSSMIRVFGYSPRSVVLFDE